MVDMLATQCFNDVEKSAFNIFLFLVCLVALQVMTKGIWWVSFWNGMQSQQFMKTLQELCGLDLCKEIGSGVLGKQEDEVMKKIFDVG